MTPPSPVRTGGVNNTYRIRCHASSFASSRRTSESSPRRDEQTQKPFVKKHVYLYHSSSFTHLCRKNYIFFYGDCATSSRASSSVQDQTVYRCTHRRAFHLGGNEPRHKQALIFLSSLAHITKRRRTVRARRRRGLRRQRRRRRHDAFSAVLPGRGEHAAWGDAEAGGGGCHGEVSVRAVVREAKHPFHPPCIPAPPRSFEHERQSSPISLFIVSRKRYLQPPPLQHFHSFNTSRRTQSRTPCRTVRPLRSPFWLLAIRHPAFRVCSRVTARNGPGPCYRRE